MKGTKWKAEIKDRSWRQKEGVKEMLSRGWRWKVKPRGGERQQVEAREWQNESRCRTREKWQAVRQTRQERQVKVHTVERFAGIKNALSRLQSSWGNTGYKRFISSEKRNRQQEQKQRRNNMIQHENSLSRVYESLSLTAVRGSIGRMINIEM